MLGITAAGHFLHFANFTLRGLSRLEITTAMKYKLMFVMVVLVFQLTFVTPVTSSQSVISRHKRHGDKTHNADEGSRLPGCGVTRACFSQPPTCQGSDCTAYVTWQTMDDGQTNFTLYGRALGYVAFGLRPENATDRHTMIPAEVYACTRNNMLRRSENKRNATHKLDSLPLDIPSGAITVEFAKFEDDVISCEFTRKPSLEGDTSFYNISGDNKYLIILAIGDTIGKNGTIEKNMHKHDWASSEAVKLQAFISQVASDNGALLRTVHASLMVIAWVGFASIGLTMARYYKPMWPSSKLLGKKVWFTLHRTCMVTCVGCSIAALAVIVVHVQGFVDTGPGNTMRALHAVFGIIVIILSIINPFMSIFRPLPGASRRPLFNWAHWGVGMSAYLIGLVTIFLGIGYHESLLSGLPRFVFFVMIAFVVFHCFLWILLEIQQWMTESRGRSNDVPLEAVNGDDTADFLVDNPNATDHRMADGPLSQVTEEGSFAKMLLLVIYVFGVVILVVFFVISFVIAEN